MKYAVFSLMFALIASSTFADHNAVQLDKMILSLPKGWEVKITRPDHLDSVGNKAMFQIEFVFPSIEYEYEAKGGRMKQHPSLWLSFYKPFSKEKLAEFERKATEIHNSERAVAPPNIFVKTENYWILTYQTGVSFRHPKEKELYQHLKKFLSINRKK